MLYYLRMLPVSKEPLEITMLCTNDPDADRERIINHGRVLGWNSMLLERLQSSASGDDMAEDGKDVFRLHRRLSSEWIKLGD